jgi:hypothetical protein
LRTEVAATYRYRSTKSRAPDRSSNAFEGNSRGVVWNALLFADGGLFCGSILVDSARVDDFTLSF